MLNFNTKSICLSLSQKLKLNKYNPKTTLHSPTTTTTSTTITTQQWRVSAHLLVLAFATNLIVRSSCLVSLSLSLSILIAIVLALGLDLLASSARLQLCFQHACILQGFNSFFIVLLFISSFFLFPSSSSSIPIPNPTHIHSPLTTIISQSLARRNE